MNSRRDRHGRKSPHKGRPGSFERHKIRDGLLIQDHAVFQLRHRCKEVGGGTIADAHRGRSMGIALMTDDDLRDLIALDIHYGIELVGNDRFLFSNMNELHFGQIHDQRVVFYGDRVYFISGSKNNVVMTALVATDEQLDIMRRERHVAHVRVRKEVRQRLFAKKNLGIEIDNPAQLHAFIMRHGDRIRPAPRSAVSELLGIDPIPTTDVHYWHYFECTVLAPSEEGIAEQRILVLLESLPGDLTAITGVHTIAWTQDAESRLQELDSIPAFASTFVSPELAIDEMEVDQDDDVGADGEIPSPEADDTPEEFLLWAWEHGKLSFAMKAMIAKVLEVHPSIDVGVLRERLRFPARYAVPLSRRLLKQYSALKDAQTRNRKGFFLELPTERGIAGLILVFHGHRGHANDRNHKEGAYARWDIEHIETSRSRMETIRSRSTERLL